MRLHAIINPNQGVEITHADLFPQNLNEIYYIHWQIRLLMTNKTQIAALLEGKVKMSR